MNKNKRRNIYPNPTFRTLEEEDKYWADHSPLKEGYKTTIQGREQKRSSFLTIRFTAEELTKLRDFAARLETKPSTIIRLALKNLYQNNILNRPLIKLKPEDIIVSHEFENSYCIVKPFELQNALFNRVITTKDKYYKEIERIAEDAIGSKPG